MSNPVKAIEDAIKRISFVCDGAAKRDNIGWNGTDSPFGKRLARILEAGEKLTKNQLTIALKMLAKYKYTQLNDIELPSHEELIEYFNSPDNKDYLPETEKKKPEFLKKVVPHTIPNVNRLIDVNDKFVIVSFDYTAYLVQVVKNIGDGNFDKDTKQWKFHISKLDKVVNTLLRENFTLTSEAVGALKVIEQSKEKKRIEAEKRSDFGLAYLNKIFSKIKRQPYTHQIEAVKHFLKLSDNRMLISDQMGLGKTMSALLCAKTLIATIPEDVHVLVLAPVSLKHNWFIEAELVKLPIEVYSYAKIPAPPKNSKFVLIADEAHYCADMKAQRTKKYLELAASDNCLGLINLTGTPMKNGRPINMYPLLKAMKHPVSENKRRYEEHYCNARATMFSKWDTTGAINLSELRDVLNESGIILRRTKEECLDLPEKVYQDVEVGVDNELEIEYQKQFKILKEDYYTRLKAGEIKSGGDAIVMMGYLRRLSSAYKVPKTIEICKDLLEQSEAVVVFTEFTESAKQIADEFGVGVLDGSLDIDSRQKMVEDFQDGKTKVFVGTIKAGGVGITLSKASYLVIHDLPWTPGDYNQATDRIHRIGQKRTCNIYNIFAKDIDYAIKSIIETKSKNIDAVLNNSDISQDNVDYRSILDRLMK